MASPQNHRNLVPQDHVSLNQVCEILGLSRPSVNRWVKKIEGISRVVVNEVHYISQNDLNKIKEARSVT